MRLTQVARGASLLAMLSSIVIGGAHAYQLTSQYLGTAPSRDNEHLLLFKLPETISSQLLVESGQQASNLNQQQQQQQNNLNHQNMGSYVAQQANNNFKPAAYGAQYMEQPPPSHPQYEPAGAVQEQAVSLTIPLLASGLHAEEQPTQAQPASGYAVRPALQSPSQLISQQANRHQQALESALAEYLVQANNQQPDNVVSVSSREPAPAQQGDILMDSNGDGAADLAALRQLQLARQLSLLAAAANQQDEATHLHTRGSPTIANDQQYSQHQSLAENQQLANYSVLSGTQQPRLWRDTQISYSPPALVSSSSASSAHVQQNNHSDVSSLVARLANSSPDLLIRLKNLLKKTAASSSSSRVVTSQTSSSSRAPLYEHLKLSGPSEHLRPLEAVRQSEGPDAGNDYFMANNVAPRELKQLIQSYLEQTRQGQAISEVLGGGGGGDEPSNSLKALLSNSNVSSHEEIKIPLILIAMPRILSFRKNNTGTTLGNSSSLPSISKVLAQRLVGQLPRLLEAAQNNLTQSTPYGRNGTNNHLYQLDTGSSSQLIARGNTTTDGAGKQVYWIGQQPQQPAPTTSVPHMHTMAPYAQQFLAPRGLTSAPLTNGPSRFIPMLSSQQPATSYQAPSIIRPMLANLSDVYSVGQQRTHAESMLVSGRNSTGDSSQNQVLSLVGGGGDSNQSGEVGFQVQLISGGSSSANEADGGQQQQKQYPRAGAAVHSLPFYDVKQTLEQPNESQPGEQRMIYVAPAASQRRSISSQPMIGRFQLVNSTTNEEPAAAAPQLRPPYDPATRTQTSYSDHQRDRLVSRLSLMEEQISKLRPLFQSAGKRTTPTSDNRTKLSPSQLMTLFSRSTDRRNWSAPRAAEDEDQQIAATQRQAVYGPGGARKSPKMVFMIV